MPKKKKASNNETDQKPYDLAVLISRLDSENRLHEYATACDTTDKYMRNHLKTKSRTPRLRMLHKLADQSGNFGEPLTREEVQNFFLNE